MDMVLQNVQDNKSGNSSELNENVLTLTACYSPSQSDCSVLSRTSSWNGHL